MSGVLNLVHFFAPQEALLGPYYVQSGTIFSASGVVDKYAYQ
jgi:hypothetical protein